MGWSLIDHACIGLCRGLMPHWIHDLKSTYCFYAHMHEITKYFLFTENQEQCLNPVWHQASAQPDACMIDQ